MSVLYQGLIKGRYHRCYHGTNALFLGAISVKWGLVDCVFKVDGIALRVANVMWKRVGLLSSTEGGRPLSVTVFDDVSIVVVCF